MAHDVKAIRESARHFNMDSSDEEALAVLDAVSGYSPLTTEEIAPDANGSLGLPEALSLVQLRQSAAWQQITDGWTNIIRDLEAKADNNKLSPSERLSALEEKRGLTKGLALVASLLEEATQRVGSLDANEKQALGPQGKQVIKEAKTLPAEVISANTQSAVEFFKGAKN